MVVLWVVVAVLLSAASLDLVTMDTAIVAIDKNKPHDMMVILFVDEREYHTRRCCLLAPSRDCWISFSPDFFLNPDSFLDPDFFLVGLLSQSGFLSPKKKQLSTTTPPTVRKRG